MIKRIILSHFMGYERFDSGEFAPINVVIGKNDTGKTGLLKLLYSLCRSVDTYSRRKGNQEASLRRIFADKLVNTFQPGKKGLGELVRKPGREKLEIDVELDHRVLGYKDRLHFSFGESATHTINTGTDSTKLINDSFRCLFIPAKEVLTQLKAIRATRDNLDMIGFDDTYLDLIRSLVISTGRGNYPNELKQVNQKLEDLFEGTVEPTADLDEFVFKKGKAEFPLTLTSEGVKKIGILTTLIRNRQLNAQSVLFMDEPETMLHPAAIRELVEMLTLLAKSGIQIFIATHNYFVLKQIHLCARREKVKASCYMLSREKESSVGAQIADLTEDLPENAISEEAIRMADEEVSLALGI
ncbi:MAG: AAA family ATPase [Saprospiraceae bacterium]